MKVPSLDGLNAAQKQAILHTDGPLLVVAGAGAGKTMTIAHRIANLIREGVPGRSILAVTFTNKAAGEMRERVQQLAPKESGVPLVVTFHALGVRLLREFHREAGIPRHFSIWDRDDSVRALKRILERLGIENVAPRSVLSSISRQKGEGVSLEAFEVSARGFREENVARMWREYESTLRSEDALDFDDLILRMRILLDTPSVLTLLRARWSHLLIDEYQDTNKVQCDIAQKLASPKNNLCVVADGDQVIYSWRGANVENFLSFEKTFPNASVVLLEQNYRSTRTILAAANAVIEKNTRRKPKKLFTENETGEAIRFYAAESDQSESFFIAETAKEFIERGVKPQEIGVLYRENFQSRSLEEAFLRADVPYRVLGTRFFERKEVKDLLSYLRASLNQKSRTDLLRIAGVPPRGIGKITLEKMLRGESGSYGAAARKIATFQNTLAEIKHAAETLPASETLRFAYEKSGLEAMHTKSAEGEVERIENVRELVNLSVRYDDLVPPLGIEKLLEEAALQTREDESEESSSGVSLMTVHASKGLEFDVVFVTGLEQGLFPSIRQNDESRDPEEERRLFYVALTRARKYLVLSYAGRRMRWGTLERTLPSEFLDDIDPRLIVYAGREFGREQIID